MRRNPLSSMLAGAASIVDGMASITGALFDHRPSPRMKRVLDELKLSDAERLRRDWAKIVQARQGGKRDITTRRGR
jgi:hypothetical protein